MRPLAVVYMYVFLWNLHNAITKVIYHQNKKTYTVSYVLHGDKKETLVTSNIITVCQACICSVSQVSKDNVKGQPGIQVFFF